MRAYNNPTLDHAVASASGEWKYMTRLAVKIREGRCDPAWAEAERKKFTGIYKRLLEDPIEELKNETGRRYK